MTDRELKDTLFVPLSVDVLEDEALNDCSMVAQLIYLRGLAHAKRAARDGIVTARSIIGGLYGTYVAPGDDGPVEVDHIEAAIDELVVAGLWEQLDGAGRYRIVGWLKHNDPVEAVENRRAERKAAKSANAHRSNHKQGQHDDKPNPNCSLCEEKPQVRPHETAERSASGTAGEPLSGPLAGHDENRRATAPETETDSDSDSQQQPRARSENAGQLLAEVEAVANIAEAFGYPDPATARLPGAVRAAQAQGWQLADLVTLAQQAALRADNPRAYWAALIERSQPPPKLLRTVEDFEAFFAHHDAQAQAVPA